MLTLFNPRAAGGRAIRRWDRVFPLLRASGALSDVHIMGDGASTGKVVAEALRSGETDFVAAGGDGTVNTVLNLLFALASPHERANLRLGAIGLGSSNDFHKPLAGTGRIPCKIRFDSARLRDVGIVTFDKGGQPRTRYFLANASVGVTAAANLQFNHPDAPLRLLKGACTPAAILYAAIRTILADGGVSAHLVSPVASLHLNRLTNLAILKSPHISGGLRFPGQGTYDDGKFRVWMFRDMNRRDLLSAFFSLSKGEKPGGHKVTVESASSLGISSAEPFPLEFDGEVVSTSSADFAILQRGLNVCTC